MLDKLFNFYATHQLVGFNITTGYLFANILSGAYFHHWPASSRRTLLGVSACFSLHLFLSCYHSIHHPAALIVALALSLSPYAAAAVLFLCRKNASHRADRPSENRK
nr:hypothetical protein [Herbaspirillum sp. ASV7]